MYICNKAKYCDEAKYCGGAQPHQLGSECGNCPFDKTAKCVEFKECYCMDEEDECGVCKEKRCGK